MRQIFLWNYTNENHICIHRFFASSSQISIPAQILDHNITQLGPYCFANIRKIPDHFFLTCYDDQDFSMIDTEQKIFHNFDDVIPIIYQSGCQELCGNLLESIILPNTITTLGSYCFYNCRNLKTISIYNTLTMIENDVFMNCYHLNTLYMNGDVRKPSGLRQILNQISWNLSVLFIKNKLIEAKILFPEFSETYDEIAPAHLFGRNITGEGFRARQCFQNHMIDFNQYDSIFKKLCVEETELISCEFALNRIFYPIDLKDSVRILYTNYIKKHDIFIGKLCIERRNQAELKLLITNQLLSENSLKSIIPYAAEQDWPEGSALLLHLQQTLISNHKKNRYSFDDNW